MSEQDHNGNERLTKVETKVENIGIELEGMWKTLRAIQDAIGRTGKWDWMTFVGIAGLIMCLWAAAIHPISADVERAAASADKLAQAVLIQNEKFEAEKIVRLQETATLDKRVSLLEVRMQLNKLP